MPLDGVYPIKREMPAPLEQAPQSNEVQTRSQQAEAQLRDAENNVSRFIDQAPSSQELSSDATQHERQASLLAWIKNDPRSELLNAVVHTEPNGDQYTFRDYFSDAPQALSMLEALIRAREQASDARVASIRAVEAIRHPMPEAARVMPRLASRGDIEKQFQTEWETYNQGINKRLKSVDAIYDSGPIIMPFSEGYVSRNRRAELSTETPGDPFASLSEATPGDPFSANANAETVPTAPHIETPPDPAAYAGPNEPTVMMSAVNPPSTPKKSSLLSRWFS